MILHGCIILVGDDALIVPWHYRNYAMSVLPARVDVGIDPYGYLVKYAFALSE